MAYTRRRGKKHLACWRGPDGRTRTKGGFDRKTGPDGALAYAQRQERAIHDQTYIDPRAGTLTVADWWGLWWPTQVQLARKTRDRDEWLWRAYVRPAFGNRELRTLTREAVGAWIADLDDRDNIGAATVVKAHGLLHKLLNAAVREQRIGRNVATEANLPKELPAKRRAIERDELDKLIGARPDDLTWRRFCLIGAYAGPRVGEIAGLRWEHVHDGWLEIDQQITDVNGVLEITRRLKGGENARRRVPIPPFLSTLLHDEREADGWLVPAPAGGPLRVDNFRERVWQPACAAAGLGNLDKQGTYSGLVPHELRHTAITWWIVHGGASLLDVQKWAGHESLRMLERVYGHLVPSHTSDVMGRLDGFGR